MRGRTTKMTTGKDPAPDGHFAATVLAGALGFLMIASAAAAQSSYIPSDQWRADRRAELTDPKRLFDRGEPRIYRGEFLEAIRFPVGGVGTGGVQMDGRGRRAAWQLWRNFTEFPLPHSLFAVRTKAPGAAPVVRALQTVGEGPFLRMKELSFRGEYPFGWYTFNDPDLPVQLSLEAFNPLIPLDEKNSALPCAIFNITAENRSAQPVEVSFLATQQNAGGLFETLLPSKTPLRRLVERRTTDEWAVTGRSSDQYGGNSNMVIREEGATYLRMTTDKPKDSPAFGEMVLLALDKNAQATASWETMGSLWDEFSRTGAVAGPGEAGPSPKGQTLDGAVATPFRLGPGEKRTASFILVWYFPNIPMLKDENCPGWAHDGHVYGSWWPDAMSAARFVVTNLPDLTRRTRLYHDSFYSANLPYWLLDRLSSQVAILRSQTVFWAKDGHFGAWEGVSWTFGSCAGNATHVWGYVQTLARMFPTLYRKMREQELENMTKEGMLPVRLGQPANRTFQAFDGQCHSILGSYLGYLLSPDRAWFDPRWPKIKQSMDFLIAGWDKDEDGMLAGPQHGMDSSHGGTSSWMGSMYLAALAASEKMALLKNETAAAARYRKILRVGAKNQDEKLFNGEYFIQIPDETPRKDYNTGCYTDQMLGQWWAHLADLGQIYPRDHVKSAMSSLFKYNFRTDFYGFEQLPRKFVKDEEPAMVQCTWPRGGRPAPEFTMLHADEVKVCITYAVAGLMAFNGQLEEAFALTRANHERADGRLRTGLANTPWSGLGTSGNPYGDDMAGKFYARTLSVWSLLIACQGETVDGPAGAIGFAPVWKPEDHVSFFSAAEGWGLFEQTRNGAGQSEKIALKSGQLPLRRLTFALAENAKPAAVEVRADGRALRAKYSVESGRLILALSDGITLQAGQTLEVSIKN